MRSPTTLRGLLGHFPCGADPLATNQSASPPPVRSPTSSLLQAILAAKDREGVAVGRAGGCRSPRDIGVGEA